MEHLNFDLKVQPGRYLTVSLVTILLIAALGGAGFALVKLAAAISLPGIPGSGGTLAHFQATPTSLTPTNCEGGILIGQWYCQVTLTNEDAGHALNWRVTSSDSSITFEPAAVGFITAGGAWPVTVVIPTNPCPLVATLTFSGGATPVTVGWTCT